MRVKIINLVIDGTPVSVLPNTTVLQACESVGVEIPRFCFHERLQVAGNCRQCVVEVMKSPKPQASCALPVQEGITIFTDRPLVKKARESVLEMMLKNHPLDCPICDQGGECDLQDQAWTFGSPWSRFTEAKRSVLDKNLGPLIKTIITRCITCTRCVRFATEVAGVEVLGTTARGESTEIGTYVGKLFDRELSGNVIDLCPVGALTSKPYAFTARPWELQSIERIDLTDALGRNTRLDTRGSDLLRILPRLNEDINEEWLADKARFCHDGLKNQRLVRPVIKENGVFKEVDFTQAINNFEKLITTTLESNSENPLGIFTGETVDLETLNLAQGLVDTVPNSTLETRWSNLSGKVKKISLSSDLINNYGFSSDFSEIENRDICLLVGVNPRTEGTLINTRLRKGIIKGNLTVANIGPRLDLTFNYQHLGSSIKTLFSLVEGKHSFCKEMKKANKVVLILGTSPLYQFENNLLSNCFIRLQKHFKNLSFNVLHNKANDVTALTFGAVREGSLNKCGLGIALEKDRLPTNVAERWIYIGSHITEDILMAPGLMMCLPSATFAEKDSSFLSLNGKLQQTKKAIPSPSDSLRSSSLLELFFFSLEKLGFDGLVSLNKTNTPSISFCKSEISKSRLPRLKTSFELNEPLSTLDEEERLFQSNIICRNSATLSVCAQTKTWSNF
jgi:NADH dehydrogenase (ubiquinone) Fe-S protein 1